VVISSPEHCTSCQLCKEACPYDAPKIVTLGKTSIVKCDLCKDRISEGRPPACIAACPTEALDAGLMEELVVKHGEVRGPDGFPDCHITKPSLVFRGMTR
jgi:anaerobic dimethyl sulfoxide reductase subunit B (iron-sulfur subunit)